MKTIEHIGLTATLAALAIVSVMLCERIDQAEGFLFDDCVTNSTRTTLRPGDCFNHTVNAHSFAGRVYRAMRAYRGEELN